MWIHCKEKMPADLEVVIALYLGAWPGRGNSGIADVYAVDGHWPKIPEGVAIVGWMPVPDTTHLHIEEHYTDQSSEPPKLLGCIETRDPGIYECVFEDDYSEVEQNCRDR